MPSSTYPGIEVIILSLHLLRNENGINSKEISERTGHSLSKVRAALSGLIALELSKKVRQSNKVFYFATKNSIRLDNAFLANWECERALLTLASGSRTFSTVARIVYKDRSAPSTKVKRATFSLKLAADLGLIHSHGRRKSLTERGAVLCLARAIEWAYLKEAKELGTSISLTRLRSRLKKVGLSKEFFNYFAIKAIAKLRKAKLSPAPALSRAVTRDSLRDERGRYLYFLTIREVRWSK